MVTYARSTPDVTVLHGDAYDLLPSLSPESIDLLITSPPYWGLRTYEQEHNWHVLQDWLRTGAEKTDLPGYEWYRDNGGILGLEPSPDWYVAHLIEIFDRFRPALKASGSVWVNLGDTYFARWASIRPAGRQGLGDTPRQRRRVPMGGYRQEKQLLLIPARFAIAMQDKRWILRNDMIWHKPNVPPRPEKDRLRLSHEHFFHFVIRPTNGRARYYYDISETESGIERRRHTRRTPWREWTYRNISRGPDTPAHPEQLPTWRHRPRSILRDGSGIGGIDRFRSSSHRIRHFLGLRTNRIQSDETSPATNTGARSLTGDPGRGQLRQRMVRIQDVPLSPRRDRCARGSTGSPMPLSHRGHARRPDMREGRIFVGHMRDQQRQQRHQAGLAGLPVPGPRSGF